MVSMLVVLNGFYAFELMNSGLGVAELRAQSPYIKYCAFSNAFAKVRTLQAQVTRRQSKVFRANVRVSLFYLT